jgi:hypothetical protein
MAGLVNHARSRAHNSFEESPVKQTDTEQSTQPDWISSAIKIFLFVIPSTVVAQYFPRGHQLLFGGSFIVGALLQALFPPRTYRLKYILGVTIAAAIVIPVINRLAGWN